jgi:divalent metal cation (Fe/Co/Zn/Cd) transporter
VPVIELPVAPSSPAPPRREALVRRARLLAWAGLAWHALEAAIALFAGVAAGSIALVGFGADSLIEATAGVVVVWRFAGARASSERAERQAQRLIAASFVALAAYVGVVSILALARGDHPGVSWPGIGLAAVTVVLMPGLALAKARVGEELGSSATKSEGRQNLVCAYLSVALLVGLGANALWGVWWADPVAALVVAAVALREARASWRGDACCASPLEAACQDECCP